jgi:osmotically-inducible protein OsmY
MNKPGGLRHLFVMVTVVLVFGFCAAAGAALRPAINGTSISDAVESELARDQAVPAYRLDVMTTEGVVTLSGTVDNILAKERAAQIAMTVKGVRAVVNKINVKPSILRTDVEIRRDIEDALLNDPATDSYEIDVAVKNNVVTLSGMVESMQEKQLSETVAKGVKGVTAVNNKIEVRWPKKRSDREIEADIEKTLEWDAYVDDGLIVVTVDKGVVRLSGTVGSATEKRLARRDAYVNGVTAVVDTDLKVAKWARDKDLRKQKYADKADEDIRRAVEDALLYDPRVASFKILTEVNGNAVTLRGTVDNLKAKRAAAQDARNTVGVRWVDNRIKVIPDLQLSEPTVEKMVQDALLRDPYVSSYQILVDVTAGVARLSGTVDSYFEKLQAEDVASKVGGVILVDNDLAVRKDYDPYIYDPYVEDWYLGDYDWYRPEYSYPTKSDAEIKEQINDELFWSPFVDADQVNVIVDQGKVTLTGTVDSWAEYNSAQENAYEGGAVYVDNDLLVLSQ